MAVSYEGMKKISVKTMVNDGGREGEAKAPNGSLAVRTSMADTPGTTTPEQLFAAGYASCFNGAMSFPTEADGKGDLKRTVRADVELFNGPGATDFKLKVQLIGHIDGLSAAETLKYMEAAHQICPYSKATVGNIEVELSAE
ncbi:Ohr family peroxiredoxin [Agrilactobacillus yilanensis]|uniref:Ohr family peroxiredoxin n=1 Tax=Agrilactobacillus yilanensis TaxID=2485997 RepID=A0ABW4J9K8_9LACO|nr:Ohr family peroxiredoxin [Agrilactobacillus yilanensis]